MSLNRLSLLFVFFLCLAAIVGCRLAGDFGDDSPAAVSQPTDDLNPADTSVIFSSTFTLATNTVELKDALSSSVTITSTVGSSTFLSAPAGSGIGVGSVLLGGNLASYPVKVINVNTSGDKLQLEAVQARLTEIFQTASFSYEGPLSKVTETAVASYRSRGWQQPISADIAVGGYKPEQTVRNLDLLKDQGATLNGFTAVAKTMSISYDPRIKIAYSISDFQLVHLSFEGVGNVKTKMDLALSVEKEGKLGPLKIPFLWGKLPIPVCYGVVATVELEIPLEFTIGAKGKISVETGFEHVFKSEFGGKYSHIDGWAVTKKSISQEGSKYFSATGTAELSASAMLKVNPSIKLYDLAGPKVSLGFGFETKTEISTDKLWLIPFMLNFNLSGEVEMAIDAWVTRAIKVESWKADLYSKSINLWQSDYDMNATPTVALTVKPPKITSNATPTFKFVGDDTCVLPQYAGIKEKDGYLVSIDKDPPDIPVTETSWTSPELALGTHTFRVMAIDLCEATSATLVYEFLATTSARVLTGITLDPKVAEVAVGASYDLGQVVVTATYDDKSTTNVKNSVDWLWIANFADLARNRFTDTDKPGIATLTCRYTENNVIKTASFTITVKKVDLAPPTTDTPASSTVLVTVGGYSDFSGQTITISLDGGPSVTSGSEAGPFSSGEGEVAKGEHVLTVKYRVEPKYVLWTQLELGNSSSWQEAGYSESGHWVTPKANFHYGIGGGYFSWGSDITDLSEVPRTGDGGAAGYLYTFTKTVTIK